MQFLKWFPQISLFKSKRRCSSECINNLNTNDEVKELLSNVSNLSAQPYFTFQQSNNRRLVKKNGERNVRSKYVFRHLYLRDIFTTIVDAKWKWLIGLYTIFYLASWLVFGLIWWLILIFHGTKCFDHITSFKEAFLLSLETSMTIGYGGRQISSACEETIFLLIVQSLLSYFLGACFCGLIYTKIARPGKRESTVRFSHHAVITKRDNKICFMFNIADVRKRQLIECHVRMYLFRSYKTIEGKIVHNHQDQLRVGTDWNNIRDESDRLFLLFPCTAVHVIDKMSPFYYISKNEYQQSNWEIVVVLEGTVEATGYVMQTRTSYLPCEVLWGADFDDMATSEDWYDQLMLYRLDKIDNFSSVEYVPECSPYDYYKSINMQPIDLVPRQDHLMVGACGVSTLDFNSHSQSENIVLKSENKMLTCIKEEPKV
ncbi:G protein-activated inward rectifier potassium channel 3 isoform X3 [Hydra vulgaris]